MLINEASFEELVNAHTEGAFTWRQLARAAQRQGAAAPLRIRLINALATPPPRRENPRRTLRFPNPQPACGPRSAASFTRYRPPSARSPTRPRKQDNQVHRWLADRQPPEATKATPFDGRQRAARADPRCSATYVPGVIYDPRGRYDPDRNTSKIEIRRISDLEILGSHEL